MTSPGGSASAPAGSRFAASTRIDGPILLDVAALVAFPILRTIGDGTLLGAWTVAVLLVAIRWPASGLGLAAALMLFLQPTRIGLDPAVALIAASSIGFAVDLALHGQPDEKMGRRLAIVVAGVIMLVAATGIALIRSLLRLDPEVAVEATRRWIEFGAGLAFFLMLLRAFSLGSIRPLVVGLLGLLAALAVSLVDVLAPGWFESTGMRWIVPGESSRATGPFASPNRLGLVAGIVAIVGACQASMSTRWRWLWAALAVASAVILVASFSRSALLGLVVAGGFVLAVRSRRLVLGYAVAAVAVAVVLVPLFVGARLAGSGGTLEMLLGNDQGRVDAWLAGIRMILAEPIFGHGFNSFRVFGESFGATDGLQTAHNEFIGLWAESGIAAATALS